MKYFAMFFAIVAMIVLGTGSGFAQNQSKPEETVKAWKDYLNKGNTAMMKVLLMDVDDPTVILKAENYGRMEDPMQTYVDAWKGVSYKLLNNVVKNANSGVVYIWSSSTKNQVKFYMERVKVGKDFKWFIRDTEIYENITEIGDEPGEIVP